MRLWRSSLFLIVSFFSTPALALTCDPSVFLARSSQEPHVIIFSAPSGGGKTTLARLLIQDFPETRLSVSSTTRSPRGTEKDGVDYHFLSTDQFKQKIAQGKFAEYAEVHGNFYGTDVDTIQNSLSEGHSVIVLPDVQGAENLKEKFPDEAVTIFILPPDMKTLEKRLRARGTDSEEAIRLRLKNAEKENEAAKSFDHVVVNDDLDRVHNELVELIKSL